MWLWDHGEIIFMASRKVVIIVEILGAVAAALAILGVVASLTKWLVRKWKNRKAERANSATSTAESAALLSSFAMQPTLAESLSKIRPALRYLLSIPLLHFVL